MAEKVYYEVPSDAADHSFFVTILWLSSGCKSGADEKMKGTFPKQQSKHLWKIGIL